MEQGWRKFEVSHRGARMEKGACLLILLLTFFTPAAKIHPNLLGKIGGEDIAEPYLGVVKPEHSHICTLALGGIICYCGLGRLSITFGSGRLSLVPYISTGQSISMGSTLIVILSGTFVITLDMGWPHSHRRHRLVCPSYYQQQSSGGDRRVLH